MQVTALLINNWNKQFPITLKLFFGLWLRTFLGLFICLSMVTCTLEVLDNLVSAWVKLARESECGGRERAIAHAVNKSPTVSIFIRALDKNRGSVLNRLCICQKKKVKWGVTAKYAHSPLSELREQAIQAILLSFNHCHFFASVTKLWHVNKKGTRGGEIIETVTRKVRIYLLMLCRIWTGYISSSIEMILLPACYAPGVFFLAFWSCGRTVLSLLVINLAEKKKRKFKDQNCTAR